LQFSAVITILAHLLASSSDASSGTNEQVR